MWYDGITRLIEYNINNYLLNIKYIKNKDIICINIIK